MPRPAGTHRLWPPVALAVPPQQLRQLDEVAAMRRASLLLGWEESWRENFTEFVLLDPRAAREAVMGCRSRCLDMLVGDVGTLRARS